jgi:anti-anti-sigma factor
VDGAELRLAVAVVLPRFRVESEVGSRVALVSLFGDLDLRVADYCEERLSGVEGRVRHVVVDLRGLTSIDRIGLHALVRAHVRSRLDGWQLTLVRGPPNVDEAFTPSFIEELFHWVDGAEDVFPPRAPPAGQCQELTMKRRAGNGGMTADSQPLRALERANSLRVARSHLKRRVGEGEVTASEVVLASPWETVTMSLFDLLRCQRMWGGWRAHRFLVDFGISETKTVGSLTDRQRTVVAAGLSVSEWRRR